MDNKVYPDESVICANLWFLSDRYIIKVNTMLNSGRRSDIAFEREMSNCYCEMFEVNPKRTDSYSLNEASRTGVADRESQQGRGNLSSSTSQLTKKMSVSEIMHRKSKIAEDKLHPAVVELKQLLSSDSKQDVFNMKKKLVYRPASKLTKSALTEHELASSLQSAEFLSHLNPEVREFNITPPVYRETPSTLQKTSFELRKVENFFSNKIYTPVGHQSEVRSQAPSLQKKGSYSYALTTQPSEPKQFPEVFRTTITSQTTICQPYSARQSVTQLQHPAMPKVHFQLRAPSKPTVRFCEPTTAANVPSTVSEVDNSVENSVGTPGYNRYTEASNFKVLIETESHYQKTVKRYEEKSSKGGRLSTKFGPMKIRNIVSVPGTEFPDFGEQESIVLDRHVPNESEHHNIYAHIQNRFSQPPLFNRQEIQLLMSRGRETSAFEPRNGVISEHQAKSAAKTQRPTMGHDFMD